MKVQIAALFALVTLAFVAPVFAQQATPAAEKLQFRKWDVSGSLGILKSNRTEFGGQSTGNCGCGGGDSLAWASNLDFGRYFSPHLKAEAGLLWTNRRSFYNSNYSYPQTFPYRSTSTLIQPVSVSGAVTYQFFENAFAHPYVSAGIRVTSLSEESQTFEYPVAFNGRPTISTSSRRSTEVRPFIAAGYKSYFSERVYMRSDILVAFGKNAFSHATARLGIGFDF